MCPYCIYVGLVVYSMNFPNESRCQFSKWNEVYSKYLHIIKPVIYFILLLGYGAIQCVKAIRDLVK